MQSRVSYLVRASLEKVSITSKYLSVESSLFLKFFISNSRRLFKERIKIINIDFDGFKDYLEIINFLKIKFFEMINCELIYNINELIEFNEKFNKAKSFLIVNLPVENICLKETHDKIILKKSFPIFRRIRKKFNLGLEVEKKTANLRFTIKVKKKRTFGRYFMSKPIDPSKLLLPLLRKFPTIVSSGRNFSSCSRELCDSLFKSHFMSHSKISFGSALNDFNKMAKKVTFDENEDENLYDQQTKVLGEAFHKEQINLKVVTYWNCFDLPSKYSHNILLLNGTKIDLSESNFYLNFNNYQSIVKPRNKFGGDVAILVKEGKEFYKTFHLTSFLLNSSALRLI
ncbi:hypothetical protein BpHYR1_009109 [Brachionus plicatilis]|uniref:Uncharacterized protein n=1 Tax=Brachionus plicatilis TaxID=10195 RepID=A0A3M7Q3P5_BRAPC|nr:hypothetical protein BpHYR1_009109 [Brachionus plicatilis]